MANNTFPTGVCDWQLSYQIRENTPDRFKFRFRHGDDVWPCDAIISDPDNPPNILGCDNNIGRINIRARIVPDGKEFWLFGE